MNYTEFKEGLDGVKEILKNPEMADALMPNPEEMPQRDFDHGGFRNAHEFQGLNSEEAVEEDPQPKKRRRPRPPHMHQEAAADPEHQMQPPEIDPQFVHKMHTLESAYIDETQRRRDQEEENRQLRASLQELKESHTDKIMQLLDEREMNLRHLKHGAGTIGDKFMEEDVEQQLGTLRARREVLRHHQAFEEAQQPQYTEERYFEEQPILQAPAQIQKEQAFQRFRQRNPWYADNPQMRALADEIGADLSSQLHRAGAAHDDKTDRYYQTVEQHLSQIMQERQQPQHQEYEDDTPMYNPNYVPQAPRAALQQRVAPVGHGQHDMRRSRNTEPDYNSAQFARFRSSNLQTKTADGRWIAGIDALKEGMKHRERVVFRPDGQGINIF